MALIENVWLSNSRNHNVSLGNLQQVVKAYAWTRAMGAEGIAEASDMSVLMNNYMEKKLLDIRGVSAANAPRVANASKWGWSPPWNGAS